MTSSKSAARNSRYPLGNTDALKTFILVECPFTEPHHTVREGDTLQTLTMPVISMGTLSKLYSNFSDASAKHAVAREFGLNHHKFLRSWLECLAVLRNCCAHHSRLSNRVFPVKPKMPERMPNTWIANFSFREQTLYPQLCYVAYWLNAITSGNTFIANFKQLLAKYPSVNTRLLGFPCNWEQEPLWR